MAVLCLLATHFWQSRSVESSKTGIGMNDENAVVNEKEESEFDKLLKKEWSRAMRDGLFKYQLNGDIHSRFIPGRKRFLLQLNPKRFLTRRTPHVFKSIAQPFNGDLFNFTKVDAREILFELPLHNSLNSKCQTFNDETIGADSNSNISSHKGKAAISSSVLINNSPLEFGHVLIVPEREHHHPQVLTEDAVRVAFKILLLSRSMALRVAYNSLGGLASVNHLHLHAYHLKHTLFLENCSVEPLCGPCYELRDWPIPGFVFQLFGNYDLDHLCRLIGSIAKYMVEKGIAHNMFVTRGLIVDQQQQPSDHDRQDQMTIRLFLWPRKPFFDLKTELGFNVAALELAGHIPCADLNTFQNLTEENVVQYLSEVKLDDELYETLKKDICALIISP